MPGCFVTGTDTGVGKSVLTAAIVAALRTQGHPVQVLKPVLTGLDEAADGIWPRDHELLAAVAGCHPEDVVLEGYGPPVSPHLAAALADRPLSVADLGSRIRGVAVPGVALVVEGVGGLLVPLGEDGDVRALAGEVGLPLLVAARPGLGTINHTLLTLAAAREAALPVAGVVLTPWRAEPDQIEVSNRETIEALGNVEVATLGPVAQPTIEALAAAAAPLPLTRWLGLE
ncbi:MAG: dethiobiotin synthase [Solirubrobacteraceae bacterium]